MSENFIWKALFISLTIHTVVMCVSFWKIQDPRQKINRQKRVEISYKPRQKKQADIQERPIKPTQQLDLQKDNLMPQSGGVPINLVKEKQMLPANMMYERKPERSRSLQGTRRVSITPIKSEKINNPAYAAYNEMVRSRIEAKVYQNYDKIETGTVYLTFMVDSKGTLMAAQVIQEKTNASDHLQEISLNSLKQASPFPGFLNGMTLPEYTFNIEVQYQVHE